MRESSESVFWLSSAWTWFSSTQAKWRMVSTARASRLIQPSSFPRLTPFRCNVRYARRDDRDGEVEGKEETGHRSVRWFNHRYRKVDFSPLFTFFFLQRESSTFGKRGNLWGFDDEEFSINRGRDKGQTRRRILLWIYFPINRYVFSLSKIGILYWI